ncbi:radical SAM protein [Streptomyces sp. NBRC 110028]|uniref:radical SAM protein n=1 Tax=Streptomyces sp. NBRC 110028 TaxID=1621260 RepID=UPI00131A76E4|nr:radical SAM protein [Streptomyces sp. NBRC 110028]
MEILRYRPVPASAVFFGITRRCPLHCKHCSTSSMLDSEEYPEEMFRKFAESFTPENRPEFVLMSGGEALLRPRLVREIAELARAAGSRSHVLSGLYFADRGRIPRPLKRAIDAVDHFSASLDRFHEEEVPRASVFRVLRELLEEGKDVSLQLTGLGPDDPYLADITAEVRRVFDDRVPMLVAPISPHGRADAWLLKRVPLPKSTVAPAPCAVSAWPVIGFNGQVTACGNQDVMDGKVPLPPHLYLGHIARDDWPAIKERALENPMVRAIRATGPEYLMDRHGSLGADASSGGNGGSITNPGPDPDPDPGPGPGCGSPGYCETCWVLSKDGAVPRAVRELADRPATRLIERQTESLLVEAGPLAFARSYGIAKYADLVSLGHDPSRRTPAGSLV